jgi:hypothetical protein
MSLWISPCLWTRRQNTDPPNMKLDSCHVDIEYVYQEHGSEVLNILVFLTRRRNLVHARYDQCRQRDKALWRRAHRRRATYNDRRKRDVEFGIGSKKAACRHPRCRCDTDPVKPIASKMRMRLSQTILEITQSMPVEKDSNDNGFNFSPWSMPIISKLSHQKKTIITVDSLWWGSWNIMI